MKGHNLQRNFLWFLCRCETVLCSVMCNENMCECVCVLHVFSHKCLQSLTHHAPFMTKHLHTPVPGVMQETVHCCTNQQLCQLLAVYFSRWKQTLSNATPIKDWHPGRAVLWKLLYLGALEFGSIWLCFIQNHWMFEWNISRLLFYMLWKKCHSYLIFKINSSVISG